MERRHVVTLKDIARASGVSTATVSYVLNDGPKSVLPETRERVQTVIRQLGYRPNAAARSLRGARTHTLGVVFPHESAQASDNEYISGVLGGILSAAAARKQVLMLFTGLSWNEVEHHVPTFFDGRCDGFIFLAPPANSQFIVDLAYRQQKVVLLGTRAWGIPVATVDANNVRGARLAVRHLLELGHRRIGFIAADMAGSSSPERLLGYREELNSAGIEDDDALIEYGSYNREIAEAAVRRLLTRRKKTGVTAVFCAHDSLADTVLRVAAEEEILIPGDLSVVGFDDLPSSAGTNPPLTTLHQPLTKIAAAATEKLLDLIDDPSIEPDETLFDVHLVKRATTRALETRT